MAVTGILVLLTSLGGENFGVEIPFVILAVPILMFALVRLGILAVAVIGIFAGLLTSFPITVDFSQCYSAQSLFTFAVFLALLFYAHHSELHHQRDLGARFLRGSVWDLEPRPFKTPLYGLIFRGRDGTSRRRRGSA